MSVRDRCDGRVHARRPLHYVLPLLAACAPDAQRTASEVNRVADEYFAAWTQRNPELAAMFGLPAAPHDRLQDNSLEWCTST